MYSLICLGMGESNPPKPGRTSKGRLVILAIRLSTTNKRSFRTKQVRRLILDHPVYAITKLDEKYIIASFLTHSRRLVYTWGNTLSTITFESRVEEDGGHRYPCSLRFKVMADLDWKTIIQTFRSDRQSSRSQYTKTNFTVRLSETQYT